MYFAAALSVCAALVDVSITQNAVRCKRKCTKNCGFFCSRKGKTHGKKYSCLRQGNFGISLDNQMSLCYNIILHYTGVLCFLRENRNFCVFRKFYLLHIRFRFRCVLFGENTQIGWFSQVLFIAHPIPDPDTLNCGFFTKTEENRTERLFRME